MRKPSLTFYNPVKSDYAGSTDAKENELKLIGRKILTDVNNVGSGDHPVVELHITVFGLRRSTEPNVNDYLDYVDKKWRVNMVLTPMFAGGDKSSIFCREVAA